MKHDSALEAAARLNLARGVDPREIARELWDGCMTLREIAALVDRHPSVVHRWVSAKAREAQAKAHRKYARRTRPLRGHRFPQKPEAVQRWNACAADAEALGPMSRADKARRLKALGYSKAAITYTLRYSSARSVELTLQHPMSEAA